MRYTQSFAIVAILALPACRDWDNRDLGPSDDPQLDHAAAEDAVSQPGLRVVITGGGAGEVRIRDELGTTLATCSGNCTVAATPGATLEVAAATPSVFAGLSGACTTSDVACNVVIGNARATVT